MIVIVTLMVVETIHQETETTDHHVDSTVDHQEAASETEEIEVASVEASEETTETRRNKEL